MSESPLRAVGKSQEEPAVSARSSGGNGGSSIEVRLASLETRVKYLATREDLQSVKGTLQYLATKEDIQKVKVWCLAGVLGGMAIAASLAVGILKLFFS